MREEITVDSLLVICLPWQPSCCSSPLIVHPGLGSPNDVQFHLILYTFDPQSFPAGVASWSIALKLLQHCQLQRIVATEVTFSSVLRQDLMFRPAGIARVPAAY